MATSALVLFSGGQDSTACLAWALARFDHVETVGFDYGQRHRAELEARPRILDRLRADFLDLDRLLFQLCHENLNFVLLLGSHRIEVPSLLRNRCCLHYDGRL